MSGAASTSGNCMQSPQQLQKQQQHQQQQQQQKLSGSSGEDMDGLAAAYERLAVRFNQLEAAYNQLRPAAAAAAAASSSSTAPLPACFRSTAIDSSTGASACSDHESSNNLASSAGAQAAAAAAASSSASALPASPTSPGASTVAKPNLQQQHGGMPLLSNKPVSLLLEEIERLRERAERAESLAAAWERQAGHTIEQLELLGSQLEELHTAALGAGSEGGRACRMLEAGLSGLRRLVSGQRALLDKLVLRESARFQQQQQQQQMMQQQRRRRRVPDSPAEEAEADMDGGDSPADLGRQQQQQPQQQLKKLRCRKRHHHQQQQHRYADEDNNEADLDDELDNEDDHLDGEDDDEVIEYIQPDGAAAASASADGGSSHYDNYGGGDGGNSDNWSRWMLAPSSSLLPRTDSLDHLREDDDDYRGFGEAGAAANFNSYGVQGLETRHYNSVDDMRAWLAAGASGGGGGFQGFADDVTLDEEVSRCLRQQQHQQQQHHLMMETDSASGCGSGERMRCPVCGLSMPPNGDLSAFNLHVNSHFADD
ncbi:hypothetical protein BOX15_Mlig019574g1 [Macrostomum lignano]|uniref:UBZ1-type domain-containing protein n=1 Tax=Macrostomum lignano TaxID=282301 RepID=A0A267FVH1_9PLAT|nr:hypothetical protein BOX15_Mlig019574g2 [Macrostomum lignano]PAA82656.1 hypothetical protein BOX15_Mlig019574g1 [Macrostomum lignano]